MGLLNKLVNILTYSGKPKEKAPQRVYDVWYDQTEKIWVAQFTDETASVIGVFGYGKDKRSAITDLHYQNLE